MALASGSRVALALGLALACSGAFNEQASPNGVKAFKMFNLFGRMFNKTDDGAPSEDQAPVPFVFNPGRWTGNKRNYSNDEEDDSASSRDRSRLASSNGWPGSIFDGWRKLFGGVEDKDQPGQLRVRFRRDAESRALRRASKRDKKLARRQGLVETFQGDGEPDMASNKSTEGEHPGRKHWPSQHNPKRPNKKPWIDWSPRDGPESEEDEENQSRDNPIQRHINKRIGDIGAWKLRLYCKLNPNDDQCGPSVTRAPFPSLLDKFSKKFSNKRPKESANKKQEVKTTTQTPTSSTTSTQVPVRSTPATSNGTTLDSSSSRPSSNSSTAATTVDPDLQTTTQPSEVQTTPLSANTTSPGITTPTRPSSTENPTVSDEQAAPPASNSTGITDVISNLLEPVRDLFTPSRPPTPGPQASPEPQPQPQPRPPPQPQPPQQRPQPEQDSVPEPQGGEQQQGVNEQQQG